MKKSELRTVVVDGLNECQKYGIINDEQKNEVVDKFKNELNSKAWEDKTDLSPDDVRVILQNIYVKSEGTKYVLHGVLLHLNKLRYVNENDYNKALDNLQGFIGPLNKVCDNIDRIKGSEAVTNTILWGTGKAVKNFVPIFGGLLYAAAKEGKNKYFEIKNDKVIDMVFGKKGVMNEYPVSTAKELLDATSTFQDTLVVDDFMKRNTTYIADKIQNTALRFADNATFGLLWMTKQTKKTYDDFKTGNLQKKIVDDIKKVFSDEKDPIVEKNKAAVQRVLEYREAWNAKKDIEEFNLDVSINDIVEESDNFEYNSTEEYMLNKNKNRTNVYKFTNNNDILRINKEGFKELIKVGFNGLRVMGGEYDNDILQSTQEKVLKEIEESKNNDFSKEEIFSVVKKIYNEGENEKYIIDALMCGLMFEKIYREGYYYTSEKRLNELFQVCSDVVLPIKGALGDSDNKYEIRNFFRKENSKEVDKGINFIRHITGTPFQDVNSDFLSESLVKDNLKSCRLAFDKVANENNEKELTTLIKKIEESKKDYLKNIKGKNKNVIAEKSFDPKRFGERVLDLLERESKVVDKNKDTTFVESNNYLSEDSDKQSIVKETKKDFANNEDNKIKIENVKEDSSTDWSSYDSLLSLKNSYRDAKANYEQEKNDTTRKIFKESIAKYKSELNEQLKKEKRQAGNEQNEIQTYNNNNKTIKKLNVIDDTKDAIEQIEAERKEKAQKLYEEDNETIKRPNEIDDTKDEIERIEKLRQAELDKVKISVKDLIDEEPNKVKAKAAQDKLKEVFEHREVRNDNVVNKQEFADGSKVNEQIKEVKEKQKVKKDAKIKLNINELTTNKHDNSLEEKQKIFNNFVKEIKGIEHWVDMKALQKPLRGLGPEVSVDGYIKMIDEARKDVNKRKKTITEKKELLNEFKKKIKYDKNNKNNADNVIRDLVFLADSAFGPSVIEFKEQLKKAEGIIKKSNNNRIAIKKISDSMKKQEMFNKFIKEVGYDNKFKYNNTALMNIAVRTLEEKIKNNGCKVEDFSKELESMKKRALKNKDSAAIKSASLNKKAMKK